MTNMPNVFGVDFAVIEPILQVAVAYRNIRMFSMYYKATHFSSDWEFTYAFFCKLGWLRGQQLTPQVFVTDLTAYVGQHSIRALFQCRTSLLLLYIAAHAFFVKNPGGPFGYESIDVLINVVPEL